MSKFQLCSCNIALAGDVLNVVARHAFTPVTYPEMLVLKFLHGDLSVTDVFDVGSVERDEDEEYARLTELYGSVVKGRLFPGAGMRLPTNDDRIKPRLEGTKANPMVLTPPPAPEPEPEPAPVDPVPADLVAAANTRRPQPVNPDAAT